MSNPTLAIDAILAEGEEGFVKRMTLARIALLEKINSPILEGKLPDRMQLMELLYVMTQPAETLKKLRGDAEQIKEQAFEWGDQLEDLSKVHEWMLEIFKDLADTSKIAPKGKDKKKKKGHLMDG